MLTSMPALRFCEIGLVPLMPITSRRRKRISVVFRAPLLIALAFGRHHISSMVVKVSRPAAIKRPAIRRARGGQFHSKQLAAKVSRVNSLSGKSIADLADVSLAHLGREAGRQAFEAALAAGIAAPVLIGDELAYLTSDETDRQID